MEASSPWLAKALVLPWCIHVQLSYGRGAWMELARWHYQSINYPRLMQSCDSFTQKELWLLSFALPASSLTYVKVSSNLTTLLYLSLSFAYLTICCLPASHLSSILPILPP